MREVELSGYIPAPSVELQNSMVHITTSTGLPSFFESKVAIELSEFLRRFNEACDGFWIARMEEKIVGSIAIDGPNTIAMEPT